MGCVSNKQEALKAFTRLTGKTVQETGLWLDPSGILDASPDVLEAKCPYTKRNLKIEEATANTKSFCLEKAQDEKGFVSKKRPCVLGPGVFFLRRKSCCSDIKGCSCYQNSPR